MNYATPEADDFRIRCSAIGDIMADPRGGARLPKGAITYLQNWFYEQSTGDQLFKGNKYTKKGWEVEDAAIDEYAKITGYKNLVKNEAFFGNDFTEGTPDILVGTELVTDIKAPWSLSTYNKYAKHIPTEKYPAPNTKYFWQLQGYLWVTGRTKAELAYVLMNTPKHLLQNRKDIQEWYDYEGKMNLKERVKIFAIVRSNSHIARIEERVKECREYLREITIPENS